jgi:ribonucleoside-triphosphate reductase
MGTLQNEWAGAQAFSSFDTYLAPLAGKDGLNYAQIKQSLQEFIFATNATSRWGNQVPFTNITLDWVVPEDMKDTPLIYGGTLLEDETYADYQDEMDMINRAFIETMSKGDMNGRVFTFPIPTYNITRDFDWGSENSKAMFDMTAKYGIPYFQNFVNSSLKPSDVRSMCCRLQLDLRDLKNKTGGLFGAGEKTGSIGVVTINMPKLGYLSKDDTEFFERLDQLIYLAKESLEIKRKEVSRNMEQGLLPWSKRYLGTLDYHFSTIGLVGMHEACLNFLHKGIETKEGKGLALKTLDFMRDRITEYQQESGHIYNLEATPAEGTSYRLARIDKRNYPEIISSGVKEPYYTNSTNLPVDYTDDIFEALQHQDELQCKYTGGTVLHGFLGEAMSDGSACAQLVKKIAYRFKLPYYTITPTFSICPVHGYIKGEHYNCPVMVNESGGGAKCASAENGQKCTAE